MSCEAELSQLPEVLVGADNLESLLIQGKQLRLASNLKEQLPKLRFLYAYGTITLPENIGEWTHLEELRLDGWKGDFDDLPDSIMDLGYKVIHGESV